MDNERKKAKLAAKRVRFPENSDETSETPSSNPASTSETPSSNPASTSEENKLNEKLSRSNDLSGCDNSSEGCCTPSKPCIKLPTPADERKTLPSSETQEPRGYQETHAREGEFSSEHRFSRTKRPCSRCTLRTDFRVNTCCHRRICLDCLVQVREGATLCTDGSLRCPFCDDPVSVDDTSRSDQADPAGSCTICSEPTRLRLKTCCQQVLCLTCYVTIRETSLRDQLAFYRCPYCNVETAVNVPIRDCISLSRPRVLRRPTTLGELERQDNAESSNLLDNQNIENEQVRIRPGSTFGLQSVSLHFRQYLPQYRKFLFGVGFIVIGVVFVACLVFWNDEQYHDKELA